jgi:hypothetical protein
MRWLIAALASCVLCTAQVPAPPPPVFVQLSPTQFGVVLPAFGAFPESHCWAWIHLGGFYDVEVACYVAGVFVAPIEAAQVGQQFDGSFASPGGGFVRWIFRPCTTAVPCPAAPAAAMYFQFGAQQQQVAGAAALLRDGYY